MKGSSALSPPSRRRALQNSQLLVTPPEPIRSSGGQLGGGISAVSQPGAEGQSDQCRSAAVRGTGRPPTAADRTLTTPPAGLHKCRQKRCGRDRCHKVDARGRKAPDAMTPVALHELDLMEPRLEADLIKAGSSTQVTRARERGYIFAFFAKAYWANLSKTFGNVWGHLVC